MTFREKTYNSKHVLQYANKNSLIVPKLPTTTKWDSGLTEAISANPILCPLTRVSPHPTIAVERCFNTINKPQIARSSEGLGQL